MRQLALYIIILMSMVFADCGKASAASNCTPKQQPTEDRLQKVEHKENHPFSTVMVARALAWRALPSTLMSPANITSFACGICCVSSLFFFSFIKKTHRLFSQKSL